MNKYRAPSKHDLGARTDETSHNDPDEQPLISEEESRSARGQGSMLVMRTTHQDDRHLGYRSQAFHQRKLFPVGAISPTSTCGAA
jgi:hypothetical protein